MDHIVHHCARADLPESSSLWQETPGRTLTLTGPANQTLTLLLPFDSQIRDWARASADHDSPAFGFERHEMTNNSTMAGSPPIKPEPSDFFDMNQYNPYSHPHQNQYNTGHGNMNINPANLEQGNPGMAQNFGQGNMSSGFSMPNSSIADDELLDLNFDQNHQPNGSYDFTANQGIQTFLTNQHQQMNQQSAGMFSHTPEGPPMQSPFTQSNFNPNPYGNFRPVGGQQYPGGPQMPQQAGYRPHMPQHIDRKVSDSRSPATPHTPGLNALQMSDDLSHPGMQQIQHQRQRSSMGNGWDSNTPEAHSWNDGSPIPSPANGHPMHSQISEVLRNNTHHHKVAASSLPAKMDGTGGYHTQEQKRRRRRESHNLVERKRRDNINERIQDLGTLVPQHRLEDEKVRKHLQTNAPLSPSIANATTGLSPPNAASSMITGPQGRRATGSGNITQGLPIEDKDKGPNKGDILNGSVAWARDLMWYLHKKMVEEQELRKIFQEFGRQWPYEQSEDEKRMHSEICEVLNKHASSGDISIYSRGPGSGLRVPGFTNVAGDPVDANGQVTTNGFSNGNNQQATSPGFQSGGSGMSSGQMSHQNQQNQFWNNEFKEEDEYGMEMQ